MDIFALAAAFGGGIFGAAIGALPVFILTGVLAIAGGLLGMANIAEFSIVNIAFGSFLGPHVTFAGGVAASAYAANKKRLLKSGADIVTPLYSTGHYSVLFVGGIFGVLGFLCVYLFGAILQIPTDLPGAAVFVLALITRVTLGTSTFIGTCSGEEKRPWFTSGKGFINHVLLGFGIGIMVCGVGQSMLQSGIQSSAIAFYPIVCFGISATSLIFAQTGFSVPATHHVTLPSALAFVLSGSVVAGVAVAIINILFGDFIAKSLNSYCDTHIDPPATTICLSVLLINIIFG